MQFRFITGKVSHDHSSIADHSPANQAEKTVKCYKYTTKQIINNEKKKKNTYDNAKCNLAKCSYT